MQGLEIVLKGIARTIQCFPGEDRKHRACLKPEVEGVKLKFLSGEEFESLRHGAGAI